ncbi:MAG: cobalamin B12-binding domain-containing protein [Deltaproteobacteria bacterium]|nr:cobalamin B12-binding domain-containing protein [Deltaproteobacteria bacterium]
MRVLLIQPPLEDFYTTPIRLYPLGLLYVARLFQVWNCQVRVLDCLQPLKKKQIPIPADFHYLKTHFEKNPFLFKGYYRFGRPEQAILDAIDAYAPDLIGISSQFTAYYESVARLVQSIRTRRQTPLFIGGNHATVFAPCIRRKTTAIDTVLTGPAENSVPDLMASHLGNSFSLTEPIDWRRLRPAHDLINAAGYQIGKKNYISLIASRGCPYACDFCSVQAMFGRKIEYRTIEDIRLEMHSAYLQKNVRIFNFEDDNLAFDRNWFVDFLNAVAADTTLRDIELTAMNGICYAHLDPDLLHLMLRAGFKRINLSLVTQDVNLQHQHRRPSFCGDLEEIVRTARRLGLLVTIYIIIGLPDQTYHEIKESIDYLLSLGVLVGPSVFYLPPGSPLFKTLSVPEAVCNNWNLYRSSAFAVETAHLTRTDLIELFAYTRRRNLENKNRPD